MGVRRWEWCLTSGTTVRASLDDAGVESVRVGQRLLSRSSRDGKPEGHTIDLPETEALARDVLPERDVIVRFDRKTGDCVLTVRGEPIPPRVAPRPLSRWERLPLGLLAAGVAILALSAGIAVGLGRMMRPAPVAAEPLVMSATSGDGTFAVSHPATFTVEPSEDDNAVTIVRVGRDETVLVSAVDVPIGLDRGDVARRTHEAMRSRSDLWASFDARDSRFDTCANGDGIITEGPLTAGPEPGVLWSCVIVRHNRVYFLLAAAPKKHAGDMALLRSIAESIDEIVVHPPRTIARRPHPPLPYQGRANGLEGASWAGPVTPVTTPRVVVSRPPTRLAPPPQSSPRRPPAPRPEPAATSIVCDANGACEGTGGAARRPSKGTVYGSGR